jgi:hypothetical protein
MRCFSSKDAVLFIKRCGAFFRPVNTGLLKVRIIGFHIAFLSYCKSISIKLLNYTY